LFKSTECDVYSELFKLFPINFENITAPQVVYGRKERIKIVSNKNLKNSILKQLSDNTSVKYNNIEESTHKDFP
jgi:hypothetical protein